MRAAFVTKEEGGEWLQWKPWKVSKDGRRYAFNRVHAIQFDNGVVWDSLNGFRGPRKNIKPVVRVPMGRRVV
jgi:hypothetical protein